MIAAGVTRGSHGWKTKARKVMTHEATDSRFLVWENLDAWQTGHVGHDGQAGSRVVTKMPLIWLDAPSRPDCVLFPGLAKP